MLTRVAAWLGVVAVAALAVSGCAGAEPRVLRLTVVLDPNVPRFDAVRVGMGSYRGGETLEDLQLTLAPVDFDAARSCTRELFIPARAELVEVQADVLVGTGTVGHGRRSITTFAGQSYDLVVTVLPTPEF